MKRLLFLLLLATTATLQAKKALPEVQRINVDSSIAEMQKQQAEFDSAQKAYYAAQESLITQQSLKNMNNNLDEFMRMQREREQSQNKALLIRIGLMLASIVLLIIGLARKKKQASDKPDQTSVS